MIYGQRIRQLREMRRLTQAELADQVPGLTQWQLSRFEKEQAQPDDETAALLAIQFGVTPEYFEHEPSEMLAAHSPQFRARSRLTQGSRNAAMQWAHLVYEEHLALSENFTGYKIDLPILKTMDPITAAKEIRPRLGFTPDQPLPYIIIALERLGVTILGLPYSDASVDAFCAWQCGRPIVAVMANRPGDRIRFSVAHEVGHLVLHDSGQTGRDIEAEADAFAAELLTPLHALSTVMPARPTLAHFTMLKTQWGVSIKSLVRRARELGVISQDRATSFYRQISSRGWNRLEPGHVPVEKPRAFRKLAELAYGPGPDMASLAANANWSEELAHDVISQYASPAELPFDNKPVEMQARVAKVVDLAAWR